MQFADVAVDAAVPQKTYTYSIPAGMAVERGQAVWVPFGRTSQLVQGIVFALSDTTTFPQIKPLNSLVESQPILTSAQCDLALWVSDYYMAPLFACAELMTPPGFRQRVRVGYYPAEGHDDAAASLPARLARVYDYLAHHQEPVFAEDLQHAIGANAVATADALVSRGLVERSSQLERPRTGPKYQRTVALTMAGIFADLESAAWKRRPKQRLLMEHLKAHENTLSVAELREEFGESNAILTALADQGLVMLDQERVTRDPLAERGEQESFPLPLTAAQESALAPIVNALSATGTDGPKGSVFLLHGVTGSGKTEVYIRALEACVAQGKRGIVLVPEIALEPQTVARFAGRFPGKVAVLHSGLTAGQAYDEWWRIRAGEFQVVIGSRSAVFAPQPDLGLIVIDEEHEPTYKQQDPAPRYHTRDVAVELAKRIGAAVVLGSATPSLETYFESLHGEYTKLELPERVPTSLARVPGVDHNRGLPQVEVVDLRQELKAGNRSLFSRSLQEALSQALSTGQQAILFLNRRGSATFVQCRDCGEVVRCRRCEIPLGYHSAREQLICHHCNLKRQVPRTCPACKSNRIRFLGAGTERVQEEVETLFPGTTVLRWDRDVARNRRTHQELLDRFAAGEAQVMVGTQMIAKGLDLPRVTVVGVVNADVNLYLPDFRAAERTFQLLTQVAGRAGRSIWAGKVVIQTYTPEHYAITSAARQDYELFAHQELAFRQRHGYPPFRPIVRLLYADPIADRAQASAVEYARTLVQGRARAGLTDADVNGPVPAFFRRVRGQYRWQVLLKGKEGRTLLDRFPPPRGWIVDIDPAQVL